jgi:hypothetical protein
MTFRRRQARQLSAAKTRAEWRDQVITDMAARGIRRIEQYLKEVAER